MAACDSDSKADSILKEMINKYQIFLEYKDTGKVFDGVSEKIVEKEFSTFYSAPDKFSFQWVTKNKHSKLKLNKVWGEDQSAYFLRSYYKKAEKMPTSKALSAAHGISGGVSFQVLPWMLFQQDPCYSIGRTKNKILNEVNYLDGISYIVQRVLVSGSIENYWISKNTLLLQKIESHGYCEGRKMESVIKYENIEYK